MRYLQFPHQNIDDFVEFINKKFVELHGQVPSPAFANFRRKTKISCLLNGMLMGIYQELRDEFKNPENYFTWNEMVEGAQDAECLVDLIHKELYCVGSPTKANNSQNFKTDAHDYVIVYTDGACSNNGKSNAQAGIGVWFGHQHHLNKSVWLDPQHGTISNIAAEIEAITQAFIAARQHGVERLSIHTDSMLIIDCFKKKWINKWLSNGWIKADGQPVENKHRFRQLLFSMEDMGVNWVHVDRDDGIEGNVQADRLAKLAANRYRGRH